MPQMMLQPSALPKSLWQTEEPEAADDFGADEPLLPQRRRPLPRPRRKRTTLVPLRMSEQLSRAQATSVLLGMSLLLPQRPQPLPQRPMNPSLQRHQSQRPRMT